MHQWCATKIEPFHVQNCLDPDHLHPLLEASFETEEILQPTL